MSRQPRQFKSVLASAILEFLTYKRALRRRFDTEEATLHLLDLFLVEQEIQTLEQISPDQIKAFLESRPRRRPRSYNHLLSTVRRLFDWLVVQGVVNTSPVRARPKRNRDPRVPFIFDQPTAARLLRLAASLKDTPNALLRGMTYRTVFALLYGLGLRVGEVARLTCEDLDWTRNLLVIRETKFYKSRLVPFGPRLGALLRDYLQARRQRIAVMTTDTPLFSFTRNRPVNAMTISLVFHALVPRLELTIPHGVSSPRLHDLRHSFAVGTLLRWYRAGIEPQSRLLHLSTFLGHVGPETTAQYLTITESLLQEANGRFDHPRGTIMKSENLGPIVQGFFLDYLISERGLRPATIRSYRDVLKLFLCFIADSGRRKVTRLAVTDLRFPQVQDFLKYLEAKRGNSIRTRNHRLTVLRVFFEYLARRTPETLSTSQQIAAIATKRTPPPETHYLEREDVGLLLRRLPAVGRHAVRDRALLLFLYNTGARAQEVADVRASHLDLGPHPRVQLHGKGDRWRICLLWTTTAQELQRLLDGRRPQATTEMPLFAADSGRALTRFGIYKIVRRHAAAFENGRGKPLGFSLSPHIFRHTAAVHLLESGTDVNVIRGWLGHVSLDSTHRYAEINARIKEAALRACEPPIDPGDECLRRAVWKNDEELLKWLKSL